MGERRFSTAERVGRRPHPRSLSRREREERPQTAAAQSSVRQRRDRISIHHHHRDCERLLPGARALSSAVVEGRARNKGSDGISPTTEADIRLTTCIAGGCEAREGNDALAP